jgi:acyl dehydratase
MMRPAAFETLCMPATMPKKYAFEDFTVGRQLEFGAYLVKREDILRFAAEFDPQPFHLDEAAAERSLFKGLSASGWHTCAIVMRITYDGLLADSTSLGSPGLESLKWTRPVRPGDTLRVRFTVLETRTMKSRPHVGLVRAKWQALNQHDEVVLDMEGWGMYGLRDAPAPVTSA